MNLSTQLIYELVAIPSVSGEEATAVFFLVEQMSQRGFEAFVDKAGNAVGSIGRVGANGRFSKQIILLGHIDTVPGDIPVCIEDGVLHGRGSVDAKGPLATFVEAAAQADLPPGTQVVVIGAVEEESATSKGARFASAQYAPDFCIIGEPSGWDGVTLGYKGRILIDYDVSLPMSHTAGEGIGAAETAVAFWNQLNQHTRDYNASRPKLFDQLLPSLRDIHTSSDGLNNSASVKIGVRLPPKFDIDTYQTTVQEWAKGATCRFYAYEPAYETTRATPLARHFNRVLREAEVRPRFKVKTGTSDMNIVAPIWNCPIVAYGPGDSALDHTPEEHLVLQEYESAIAILRRVLETL